MYCLGDGKPHVVMIPYPLQGHVIPLMRLAKLLTGRGLGVTFVVNEMSMERMEAVKVAELKEMGIWVVGIRDGWKQKAEAGEMRESKDALLCLPVLERSFEKIVGGMMGQLEGPKIKCIISDAYLPGTQETASKWGIPRVCFWPNSLATLACSLSLPQILQAGAANPSLDPFKPLVYMSKEARMLDCIPGLSAVDMRSLPFHTMGHEYNASWLRGNIESQIACVSKSLCIVCNSFLDLEREVHEHLQAKLPTTPILTIGPLLPPGFLGSQDPLQQGDATGVRLFDEEEDSISWLDSQKQGSVLYISMGSLIRLREAEVQKIAMGLEASKQPFLWVLGSSSLNKSSLPPQLENQGKITRWVAQSRVLSHRAIGGFLTHCGWNSTLESISLGVPMIGWPRMMDQMTNSWYVVEKWKVGLKLELEELNEVGHTNLERCIERLMQEDEGHLLRAHARCFCSKAQAALTSMPSTLDILASIILSSSSTSQCE